MENPGTAWWSPSRYASSPESVDRALTVACAVAWLAALGVGVAATVALVQLGGGATGGGDEGDGSGTPWLLYVVIGVSAAVIVAAVPLLLRARQTASPDQPDAAGAPLPARTMTAVGTAREAAGRPGSTPAPVGDHPSAQELDRILLRVGLGVLTATGVATVAVALAAYLLAVGSDGAAWGALGVAAVITVAMSAIPVLHLRELRAPAAPDDAAEDAAAEDDQVADGE